MLELLLFGIVATLFLAGIWWAIRDETAALPPTDFPPAPPRPAQKTFLHLHRAQIRRAIRDLPDAPHPGAPAHPTDRETGQTDP